MIVDVASATDKQREALVKLRAYGSIDSIPFHLTKVEASKQIDESLEREKFHSNRPSLATLRSHDPSGGRGSVDGKHYLCPFASCRDHQDTRKHRSLSVSDSGQYICHRCHSKGLLSGFQAQRLHIIRDPRIERLRRESEECFKPTIDPHRQEILDRMLSECISLSSSAGEAYLANREIIPQCAIESGVLFHPSWYGIGAAVVFLSMDERGKTIGAQGRYIDSGISPKMRGVGRTSVGTFRTFGAFKSVNSVIAISESPIDALSIYQVSHIPCVALFGVNVPLWLRRRCSMRHVLIATDSDDAGEKCASRLLKELNLSISVQRVAFPDGFKDANEALIGDSASLVATIREITKRLL